MNKVAAGFDIPLVIAAHGTRDKEGVEQCRALANRVAQMLPGVKVTIGFVELAEPSIDEAVAEALAGRPVSGGVDAVVVPLMLTTGGHVREDIPEMIDEGKGDHLVAYAAPLLPSPRLLEALEQRVGDALGDWDPRDTHAVLIGRGSLVAEANAEHAKLCRMLLEDTNLANVQPAYIQVTRPSIPEALNMVAATGAKQILVAQHFLFKGKLRTWTYDQVNSWKANHPQVEVRISEVIGDCDELAKLVIDRYSAELEIEGLEESAPGYLSSLHLAGRDVLVVGGGAVASRRIPALLAAGAKVRVVAPNLGIKVSRLAASGAIQWEQRPAKLEDVSGAWYVLAAANDPEVNKMIAEAAEANHTFCVRSDLAKDGSASTPATDHAGGLTVAVVGQRNPRRSVRVRDELLKVLQG